MNAAEELARDTARRAPDWNAGRIQRALVRHLNWFQNLLIPEFELDGSRADLLQVTRAGYATEYEIKISAGDWRRDQHKGKFDPARPLTKHLSRFFYVVPGHYVNTKGGADVMGNGEYLPLIKMPDWLPDYVGILLVLGGKQGYDSVHEMRAARRFKALPVPASVKQRAFECFYYRYWRYTEDVNVHNLRREIAEARKTCRKCYGRLRCTRCEARELGIERRAAAESASA